MASVPTKRLKAADMTKTSNGNGNEHKNGDGGNTRAAMMQRPALKGQWSEPAVRVLRERYLWKKDGAYLEDEDGLCWRVATAVAQAETNYGGDVYAVASQFYEVLVTGKFLANSPTLMNAGKDNGLQLSACFVIPVEDTIEGIFDAVKYAAIIHKSGGGTGFSFSRLRPEGSTVGTSQGVASGPVSFMRIFDAATEQVKQGGTRRGANMGILRVDHPDVEKFITCKLDGGVTNFNISVAATDAFMQAVKDDTDYDLIDPHSQEVMGQKRARDIWDQIVDAAWRSGDPGFVFIDRANNSKSNPTPTIELLEATNPCVTGDTLVYTADGLHRIDELVARDVAPNVTLDARLMDGIYGPATVPFVTGTKPVYRLTTNEGYEVRLTEDHRVLTKKRGWVAARDLAKGDKIHLLNHKGGFGSEGAEAEGRVIGWLIGDGHIKERDQAGNPMAYLEFWGNDRGLASDFAGYVNGMVPPHLTKRESPIGVMNIEDRDLSRIGSTRLATMVQEGFGITRATKIAGLPAKAFQMSEAFQRGLLQALFTTDGTVTGTAEKGVTVRLTSISTALLKDVQRMLLNFGVASRIYTERHKERAVTIRERTYQAHADHDLVIGKENVLRFADEIGFMGEAKRNTLNRALATYGKRGPYRESFFATFADLVSEGEEIVYDLTEPITHSFIANGLVLHNCGEQWLGPFDACNLGSINLAATTKRVDETVFLDWEELERVTRLTVRFLDDVIDVNPLPLPQIQEKVRANRRIGLGVMGWADLLFLLNIPYDSDDALALGTEIMAKIEEWGWDASRTLAEERGPFPNFAESIFADGPPVRNGTVTTVAPTGSISILADCSSGIEPIFALAFQHRVKQGKEYRILNFVNPIFKAEMERRGLWSDELERHLIATGSVKGAPGIPEEIQKVYVTAQEISPEWHVRQQAAWQKHVDNSISKTVNLPNDATHADVAEAYLSAYDTGCKGITVFRDGCKSEQVLNIGVKETSSEAAAPAEAIPAPVGTGTAAPAPMTLATIKPRPDVVRGYTRKLTAPEGKVFITINSDGDGPLEVFATVGRAGTDIEAMADGMGRLISLTLRLPSTLSQAERAKAVAENLRGIGGSRTVGFGPAQIRSLPDAIGKAIAMHFGEAVTNGHTAAASGETVEHKPSGNLCPQCGSSTAFVLEEGCKKCHACGYSEC
jgi:ribonucleoside-diphosphate reductase alpha chain